MNSPVPQQKARSSVETWLSTVLLDDLDDSVREPLSAALAAVQTSIAEHTKASEVFLTVVMRTQGRKIEAFRDALLTLYGQTDQDFELLIMPHNVDADTLERIESVVADQAPSFRRRIRVIPVNGGNRSRPLNESLGHATGQYLAFFDDDDLVLGNWVELFRKASKQHPGRLVRTIAATQRMQPEEWPGGTQGFRTTTWPSTPYPATFEIEHHLERNHSPFMSVAFPWELFALWGNRFDEELDVTEDWDMILRGAFLVGVVSVEDLAVIYRFWDGATSSYTEHDRLAWSTSEARVRRKLNARPLILPEGAPQAIVGSIGEIVPGASSDARLNEMLQSNSWKITRPLRDIKVFAQRVSRRIRR